LGVASRSAASRANVKELGIAAVDFDITDSNALDHLINQYPSIQHLIITSSAPLLFQNVAELELNAARQSFEKFWNYLAVIQAFTNNVKTLQSVTIVSGAIAKKNLPGILIPKVTHQALNDMVKVLALEFAPIRINAISPGPTDTALYDDAEDRKTLLDNMAKDVPLKRIAHSNEVAAAIVFAVTNKNMTGSIIDVDGGAHL
jgi:NAD(P)-dependent dehydrogenase (short-subunit alcohol dehydrogenase family)